MASKSSNSKSGAGSAGPDPGLGRNTSTADIRPAGRLQRSPSQVSRPVNNTPRAVSRRRYRNAGDAYQAASSLLQIRNTLLANVERITSEQTNEFKQVSVEAARAIRKPSVLRYGPYISACILMDLFGILISALNLSGIALVITFFANLVLMVFMWGFGRILLGSRLRQLTQKKKELEDRTTQAQNDIRRISAQFARFRTSARGIIRRSPKLAARATRVTRRVVRLTKFKPVGKVLGFFTRLFRSGPFKFIVEAIPFLQALPWWSIGAIAAYVEHRGEYRDAQLVLSSYRETKSGQIAVVTDLHGAQLDVVEDELREAAEQTNARTVASTA